MQKNFQIMIARVGSVAYELQRLHFAGFQTSADAWQPAINAYLCNDELVVCLDLAGVSRDDVTIQVDERRLVIRGHRLSPEQFLRESQSKCRQILAMEIEHGPFSRVLNLPIDIDPDQVRAEHRQGLLWIQLPIRKA
jgi:HSP20 family protein